MRLPLLSIAKPCFALYVLRFIPWFFNDYCVCLVVCVSWLICSMITGVDMKSKLAVTVLRLFIAGSMMHGRGTQKAHLFVRLLCILGIVGDIRGEAVVGQEPVVV